MIYQMLYQSMASEDLSYSDLNSILNISRDHNLKNDLTGVLLFRDGRFLHFIEGEKQKVRDCMKHIILDRRHTGVKILAEAEHDHRAFPETPLDFVDGDLSRQPHFDSIVRLFHLATHHDSLTPADHLDLLEYVKLMSKSPSLLATGSPHLSNHLH